MQDTQQKIATTWPHTDAQYLLSHISTSYPEGWSHLTGVSEIGTNHKTEQTQEWYTVACLRKVPLKNTWNKHISRFFTESRSQLEGVWQTMVPWKPSVWLPQSCVQRFLLIDPQKNLPKKNSHQTCIIFLQVIVCLLPPCCALGPHDLIYEQKQYSWYSGLIGVFFHLNSSTGNFYSEMMV